MKRAHGGRCFLWLLAVALPCVIGFNAAAQATQGVKRALLIGINEYQAVPSLQGSINDVDTMREILVTRWGFAPRNITVLRNSQAVRSAMLAAIQQLVRQSQPNDIVYFHYSGHGSQVQDLNGDEPDGLDETLVPQDGRTAGVPDITDDELDAAFARLNVRSATIVLDSCHSGTATRALDIRTRSVPRDSRVDLYQSAAVGTRAIVPRVQTRYVVMSGAASNEEALDGPVEGRYHGFFTYALSKSLGSSPLNASPRTVFSGVARELGRIQSQFGRASMPEPQLEAPAALLDQPLLGGGVIEISATNGARLAWLSVQPTGGGQLMLINGTLLGAVPGSTWAIYPAGETAFLPGRKLAIAIATQAVGKDTRAMLQSAAAVPNGARAVLSLPAPTSPRIAIKLGNAALRWRGQIEAFLSRSVQGAQIVAADQPARFLIDADGTGLKLLTADGLQVLGPLNFAASEDAADISRLMLRSGQAVDLLTIDNPAAQLRVDARVIGVQSPLTRDIALVADTRPAQLHVRRPGEPRSAQNSLQMQITVNVDAYLTIVDVGPDGAVNLLFPNDHQNSSFWPEGRVRGNEVITIPDSLAAGNQAGFFWDYSPPHGIDTVRVFASTDANTANSIRERVRAVQSPPMHTRGMMSEGGERQGFAKLRDDLQSTAARGIAVVRDSTGPAAMNEPAVADWAATSLNVAVGE